MPEPITLEHYKQELEDIQWKKAKEGWAYLVSRGVPEQEVFGTVCLPFSDELELLTEAYKKARMTPRQVRALGKQLKKCATKLSAVMVHYPELLPISLAPLLEPQANIRMKAEELPKVLQASGDRLAGCKARASVLGEAATMRRGRTTPDPSLPSAQYLMNLFSVAAARLDRQGAASPSFEPPRECYVWAEGLLNLACALNRRRRSFTADALRKVQDEHSLKRFGS